MPELESEDSAKWRSGASNDFKGSFGKHNRHQSFSFTNNTTGFGASNYRSNDSGIGGQGPQRVQGAGRGGFHSR